MESGSSTAQDPTGQMHRLSAVPHVPRRGFSAMGHVIHSMQRLLALRVPHQAPACMHSSAQLHVYAQGDTFVIAVQPYLRSAPCRLLPAQICMMVPFMQSYTRLLQAQTHTQPADVTDLRSHKSNCLARSCAHFERLI